ncbi:hypothetical protein CARUB_v10011489mg [Capsella rubella]|uniref:S-locus receptor kinase C-terminal domain-containing protein n=1 Tax=Capsella rubella TaxID=81985 RepID=R0I9B2_9BRAS|nr:hypothetical protein CARUB_v10011489mg [Capsella rubella]
MNKLFPELFSRMYGRVSHKSDVYSYGMFEIAKKKMTLVGLWCIQSSPSDRPSMDRVVEMMEGNLIALEILPRPVFQIPIAPFQESSTISEDVSAYTEVCSLNIT